MNKQYSLDKYHNILFREYDENILTVDEKKILIRYRAIFTLSLETPWVTDVELRDFLVSEYGISIPQAYKDLTNVRVLLGKVQNAGKEWIRYMVIETLKKCIKDAEVLGKTGIKLKIMAARELAKYNRLDKEDSMEIPWDDIIPQSIEPTTDPTVLGIKPLENKEEAIRKMYEKYKDEIEIEDVDYEPAGE